MEKYRVTPSVDQIENSMIVLGIVVPSFILSWYYRKEIIHLIKRKLAMTPQQSREIKTRLLAAAGVGVFFAVIFGAFYFISEVNQCRILFVAVFGGALLYVLGDILLHGIQ